MWTGNTIWYLNQPLRGHKNTSDVEVGEQTLEVGGCTAVSESGVTTRLIQSDRGCGVLQQDYTQGLTNPTRMWVGSSVTHTGKWKLICLKADN